MLFVLSFFSSIRQWAVKSTSSRGLYRGWMFFSSDPPTRPELTRGTCEVLEGKGCWKMQERVTVVALAKGNYNNLSTLILNLSSIFNPI